LSTGQPPPGSDGRYVGPVSKDSLAESDPNLKRQRGKKWQIKIMMRAKKM